MCICPADSGPVASPLSTYATDGSARRTSKSLHFVDELIRQMKKPPPLQSGLRVHGSAKTSTLASSVKSLNPVRRVWTVPIEASCSLSLDSRDCGAPQSFHGQNQGCGTLWPCHLH